MNITIVGTGYVGLVTGTCFAEMGNQVTCIDIDEAKLAQLEKGIIPIHEPGLDAMISRNVAAGRLKFESNLTLCIDSSELVFIAVGTPPSEDGSADLSHVLNVAKQIGDAMVAPLIVIDKSTVPVGTADKVKSTIAKRLKKRGVEIDYDVVSNPEFLKEGAAIDDFMSPDRIIVGTHSEHSKAVMRTLYAPFSRNHDKLQFMGTRDAEMTKYAANAMLATKISFMNEIALMCESLGVDVESVRKGIGSDPRIGFSFIYPGAGYGGSCFPKDVRALVSMAYKTDVSPMIFSAVESRNSAQKQVMFKRINEHFDSKLENLQIALWGLAFKPETDDVREAPALVLLKELIDAGVKVKAYDAKACETSKFALGELAEEIEFVTTKEQAINNADALVVMTEWKEFRQPNFVELADKLKRKVIFDGRNVYEPAVLADHGITHIGIGRGSYLLNR
ncbi:MAG: UDP-glucose dehydrogenase family protein [Pseudomonadales bacterium]